LLREGVKLKPVEKKRLGCKKRHLVSFESGVVYSMNMGNVWMDCYVIFFYIK